MGGVGREAEGQTSPCVRPKKSLPFRNPGNPTHACEDHGRASKQPSSLDIFLRGRRFSFLPAFRETEKEGGAEHSSGAGRFLVLKSLESKTLHRTWRFM